MSQTTQDAIEDAARLLGWTFDRWKGEEAVIVRGEARLTVDLGSFGRTLEDLPNPPDTFDVAYTMSEAIGLPLTDALMADFERARFRLRPRLVGASAFKGRGRSMCRREAFAGLYRTLGIGVPPGDSHVTTTALDEWPVDFDEAMMLAMDNARKAFTPDSIKEIVNTEGVLAIMSDEEPGSTAALFLKDLLPEHDPRNGWIFSVPGRDITLVLPVIPGGGADGFANLVQITFTMAADRGEDMLSNALFWETDEGVDQLHTTCIVEEGARRVHVEARGITETLFRILGTIEP